MKRDLTKAKAARGKKAVMRRPRMGLEVLQGLQELADDYVSSAYVSPGAGRAVEWIREMVKWRDSRVGGAK